MDSVVEESVELIAAALLLVGALGLLREIIAVRAAGVPGPWTADAPARLVRK